MNAMNERKRTGGPSVIRFKARLYRDPKGVKNGSWSLLDVPSAVSKNLGVMPTLEGTINGHPFRASLESSASGTRSLRVNQAMRKGARAGPGDTVELAVLGPEPEPKIPPDLRAAFRDFPEATALWKDLTKLGRLDWIRWIEGAKTSETRARRITRTVEQLAEGKRRPCCVNFYEFMLQRVRQ